MDYDTCTCKSLTPKQTWPLHAFVVDVAGKHMSYCAHTMQATESKIRVTVITGRYHGGTILPCLGLVIHFGTFDRKDMAMFTICHVSTH